METVYPQLLRPGKRSKGCCYDRPRLQLCLALAVEIPRYFEPISRSPVLNIVYRHVHAITGGTLAWLVTQSACSQRCPIMKEPCDSSPNTEMLPTYEPGIVLGPLSKRLLPPGCQCCPGAVVQKGRPAQCQDGLILPNLHLLLPYLILDRLTFHGDCWAITMGRMASICS